MYGDATFSDDDRYRYLLWRCWEPEQDQLTFVLCNPSVAGRLVNGQLRDDNTVNRLVDIALAQGSGGFVLVNLVAHVEPKSSRLRAEGLEGPENLAHLNSALRLQNKVVIGWGATDLVGTRDAGSSERSGNGNCGASGQTMRVVHRCTHFHAVPSERRFISGWFRRSPPPVVAGPEVLWRERHSPPPLSRYGDHVPTTTWSEGKREAKPWTTGSGLRRVIGVPLTHLGAKGKRGNTNTRHPRQHPTPGAPARCARWLPAITGYRSPGTGTLNRAPDSVYAWGNFMK